MVQALLLVGSLLLLAVAVPAAILEIALTAGNPARAALVHGLQPAAGGEARLEASRALAVAFGDSSPAEVDLGLLALARARRLVASSTADALPLFADAARHFERGLARDPAQPFAWALLAHVHLALGEPETARRALALSYRTGPVSPSLVRVRAPLALLLAKPPDPSILPHLRRDLQALARRRDGWLVGWARAAGLEEQLERLLDAPLAGSRPAQIARSRTAERSGPR